jgi:hypothetical protein
MATITKAAMAEMKVILRDLLYASMTACFVNLGGCVVRGWEMEECTLALGLGIEVLYCADGFSDA